LLLKGPKINFLVMWYMYYNKFLCIVWCKNDANPFKIKEFRGLFVHISSTL
jgi:hypothetical protein